MYAFVMTCGFVIKFLAGEVASMLLAFALLLGTDIKWYLCFLISFGYYGCGQILGWGLMLLGIYLQERQL